MNRLIFILILFTVISCSRNQHSKELPWEKHGKLEVHENEKIIRYEDGTPFLWLGCSSWGMTEWLSREDVDFYLDDRKSKGMNVVQLCLFWGKREENPTRFTANAPDFYGFKALEEDDGFPDATRPAVVEGGSPENPNDYWDHVDYCLDAIKKRGMYAAVLPFWGRRYVNATHEGQSKQIFTLDNIFQFAAFLGKRYGNEPHIIWVNGGDVKATSGGDFRPQYRLLAEGLIYGITGQTVHWNQESYLWDKILMTYHPDGSPMINSSEWFQNDPWLDFNMIETHIHKDFIAASIRQDLKKQPLKPTVLAEGHYEGMTNGKTPALAIHIRRQAYQTFFAGATGHTYGGGIDENENGPLFSPYNNWKQLLNWEGASQLIYLRKFLEENEWWNWKPLDNIILDGKGEGELEKLAVTNGYKTFVYFPENSHCKLTFPKEKKFKWFNTKSGKTIGGERNEKNEYALPENWEDGILVIK
jgi:hypothetical protein